MTSVEALAWAQHYMGEPGPYVRKVVPGILAATHSHYVTLQVQSRLPSSDPYGLIWLGMPQALVEKLHNVAGVQIFHPKRGRFSIPLVNNVPLVSWRFGRDKGADLKVTPFGRPVSGTRRHMFAPPELQPQLPLGDLDPGNEVMESLDAQQRDELEQHAIVAKLLAKSGAAAVLAYASNPDAILKAFFGYAVLDGDMLDWAFIEPLDVLALGDGMLREVDDRHAPSTFDSGPLEEPEIRLRPLVTPGSDAENGSSGDEAPPTAHHNHE